MTTIPQTLQEFDEEFVIGTKNGLRTAMTDGAIHDYEIRKIKSFIFLALNHQLDEGKALAEEMREELPKTKCRNAENHLFGSCFQCEKTKGGNEKIDLILTSLESLRV